MSRNNQLLRALVVCGLLTPLMLSTKRLPAGYTGVETRPHVEIDGIDYGPFDQVLGMDAALMTTGEHGGAYAKITLARDFVTDPSLYLWAKNTMHNRSGLKDVFLVMEDGKGKEHSRYVLKLCQPLSWTVEASNPSLGGFHETVDLAVQGVSAY